MKGHFMVNWILKKVSKYFYFFLRKVTSYSSLVHVNKSLKVTDEKFD